MLICGLDLKVRLAMNQNVRLILSVQYKRLSAINKNIPLQDNTHIIFTFTLKHIKFTYRRGLLLIQAICTTNV